MQELVSAALEIAGRRKATLESMRRALESGDNGTALRFARQLCGLESENTERNARPN
jgi:hypothetical protein